MVKSLQKRLKLHNKILEHVKNAYYQPPENIKLTYPCVVYNKTTVRRFDANNRPYLQFIGYQLTVIEREPDSDIANSLTENLEYCSYQTFFSKDNLNHTVLMCYEI